MYCTFYGVRTVQGNSETTKKNFLSKKRKYSFPLQRLTFTEEMDSKQPMTYVYTIRKW